MKNSQTKKYICKEENIINFDSILTIKRNSIWNYNNSSEKNLLYKETVLLIII